MPDSVNKDFNALKVRIVPSSETMYRLRVECTIEQPNPDENTEIDPDDPCIRGPLERIKQGRADDSTFEELGIELFECLFKGSVGTAYVENLLDARREARRGVRIMLEISRDATGLYDLPWNLLLDPNRSWWLGELSAPQYQRTPIGYSVLGVAPVKPVSGAPIRVLAIGAQPEETSPLNIHEEIEGIIEGAGNPDRVVDIEVRELVSTEARPITRRDLQEQIRAWGPHILHFVCHGPDAEQDFSRREGLYLQDDEGAPHLYGVKHLLTDIRSRRETVRLVVFDVCNSDGGAWKIAAQGIQAIGMSLPINKYGARLFARGLYEALSEGIQLDESLNMARAAIRDAPLAGKRDWMIPSLFLPRGEVIPFPQGRVVDSPRFLQVESRPIGASVLIDGNGGLAETGEKTPASLTVSPERNYVVEARLAGYVSQQREVSVGSDLDPEPVVFVLKPDSDPPLVIQLDVKDPSGRSITSVTISWRSLEAGEVQGAWVDLGKPNHRGFLEKTIPPGTCEFRALPSSSQYRSATKLCEIRAGLNVIAFELEGIASACSRFVSS